MFAHQKSMKVSVIVSTYTKERHRDVLRCINSLLNQTIKPDEIILVLDPIEDLIDFYKKIVPNVVKIIASSNFGLSNARNIGVMNAKGDIIAFIDDDAWADKRWLGNLLKNFEDEKVWIVGGKIIPVFDKRRPRWLAEELNWIVGCSYKGLPESKAEVRNPIGANMAFRRKVFEVVDGFRSEIGRYGRKLLGCEETELCLRLKKMRPDVKIIYDPSAVVYHRVPLQRTTMRYVLKRAYYEGYSKAILAKEYPLSVEHTYLSFLLRSMLDMVLKGKFSEAAWIVVVVVCVIAGNIVGRLTV